MLHNRCHFPPEVAVEVVDEQADDEGVPELDEPGNDLSEEADGVAAVPVPDDGLLEQVADGVVHLGRVDEDGQVADELDEAESTSKDREKVQDDLPALSCEAARVHYGLELF